MRKHLARLLKPKLYVRSINEISLEHLSAQQMKGIIVDLDNTLTPWGSEFLSAEVVDWLKQAKMQGFKVCLVSNNKGERISRIAGILDIPFIASATKPRRRAFLWGMEAMGTNSEETAVIGDQIFTDVLGGNRLGLYTILVFPMSTHEFFGTRLMRMAERPVLSRIRGPE